MSQEETSDMIDSKSGSPSINYPQCETTYCIWLNRQTQWDDIPLQMQPINECVVNNGKKALCR